MKMKEKVIEMYFEFDENKKGESATPYFVLQSGIIIKASWVGTGSCWMTQFEIVKTQNK